MAGRAKKFPIEGVSWLEQVLQQFKHTMRNTAGETPQVKRDPCVVP